MAVVVGIVLGASLAAGRTVTPSDTPTTQVPTQGTPQGTGSISEQISELEDYLEQNPHDTDARLELGILFFNIDMIESARAQWEKVLEVREDDLGALFYLGYYYLALDPIDYENAHRVWSRVIELDDNSRYGQTILNHWPAYDWPEDLRDPVATGQ
ncbi:MAG: hypothetical protein FWD55_04215 [Propionibacteriaceae bacterium]|nr:hypothetical protein [Propionibacteriaceae bacterium]